MPPSHVYRSYLRDIRIVMYPHEEALLLPGECINNLTMEDLEVLYELIAGFHPRVHAPAEYRCRH